MGIMRNEYSTLNSDVKTFLNIVNVIPEVWIISKYKANDAV